MLEVPRSSERYSCLQVYSIGKAFVIKTEIFVDTEKIISENEIQTEINRFLLSRQNLINEFGMQFPKYHRILMIYGNFKTDLMMIEDDFLSKTTIKHINDLHTAEALSS